MTSNPPYDFRGRVAIVTGAAGNLGFSTAKAFQMAGAATVLIDRSQDRLREMYSGAGPDLLLAGGTDLINPESLAKVVQEAQQRFGAIDVLVNTVGAFRGGKPVHESDPADWDFLFNANVRTTLFCCRAVIPTMLRQKRGKIINVASRNGLVGEAGYAAYAASKSAVIRLTEALSAELKNSDINVNCILPSTIDTPQNRQAFPQADFSKWVEPAALSDVILFLASDASRAVHGATLPVYGKA
jgi:NAD(P)-dependent dehydrogenase (short-subunit alcohol dehydrogenase family)